MSERADRLVLGDVSPLRVDAGEAGAATAGLSVLTGWFWRTRVGRPVSRVDAGEASAVTACLSVSVGWFWCT
ncbi:hypothetical protein [Spongiactinospora gelatinilytica]|nr:hypothetical protein [Spongiactinospora gelatinilytica]